MDDATIAAVRDAVRDRAFAYLDAGLGGELRLLMDLGDPDRDEVDPERLALARGILGYCSKLVQFVRPQKLAAMATIVATPFLDMRAADHDRVLLTLEEGSSPGVVQVLPHPKHSRERPDLEAPVFGGGSFWGGYRNDMHPRCLTCGAPVEFFSVQRDVASLVTTIGARCHGQKAKLEIDAIVLRTVVAMPRPEFFPPMQAVRPGAGLAHTGEAFIDPVEEWPNPSPLASPPRLGLPADKAERRRELTEFVRAWCPGALPPREDGPGIAAAKPPPRRGVAVYCQSDEDGDV